MRELLKLTWQHMLNHPNMKKRVSSDIKPQAADWLHWPCVGIAGVWYTHVFDQDTGVRNNGPHFIIRGLATQSIENETIYFF